MSKAAFDQYANSIHAAKRRALLGPTPTAKTTAFVAQLEEVPTTCLWEVIGRITDEIKARHNEEEVVGPNAMRRL